MRELWEAYRYHGRHRREAERHTTRDLALVGALTLAGVGGLPAVGVAAVAVAAPPGGWDPLLDCESDFRNVYNTADPKNSTANGYFQITNPTWRDFGGTAYAPIAMQATRAEQQTVAERIYNKRALQPWIDSVHCWGDKYPAHLQRRPRGGSVDTEPTKEVPRSLPKPPASSPDKGTAIPDGYVVKRGDTLSGIARRFGVPGGYREAARVNNIPDPNLIIVGTRLR